MGLCAFSLPISLVMIEKMYWYFVLLSLSYRKYELLHCLGLGHEIMVCTVYLSISLSRYAWISLSMITIAVNIILHILGKYMSRIWMILYVKNWYIYLIDLQDKVNAMQYTWPCQWQIYNPFILSRHGYAIRVGVKLINLKCHVRIRSCGFYNCSMM